MTSESRPDGTREAASERVRITRKVTFSASHRYHNASWSQERNREIFGACNRPHGHGHNYLLEVTVEGLVDPETGMVLNLREVDGILDKHIVAVFDHRHINEEVPGFDERVPTTENLVVSMWEMLEPVFQSRSAKLHRLRLFETADLYAEYLGETDAED